MGKFDVLVGINLLREGLDIPEVSLVAILDADKEGFLRSETALIQTCGRASRNVNGRVIMYADKETTSIAHCIAITQKRREKQELYNTENNIIPKTVIRKQMEDLTQTFGELSEEEKSDVKQIYMDDMSEKALEKKIRSCKQQMLKAAKNMQFEEAAHFRDLMHYYQSLELIK
jgi:excinuclease ABC subunit B